MFPNVALNIFMSSVSVMMCAFFFLWKKDFTLWTSSAEVSGGPGVTFGLTAASFLKSFNQHVESIEPGYFTRILGEIFLPELPLHKLQTLEPSMLKDDEGTLLR